MEKKRKEKMRVSQMEKRSKLNKGRYNKLADVANAKLFVCFYNQE